MSEKDSRRHPVAEDMRFQRRTWVVERATWVGLALLACAALTGLFSQGPLSKASATASQGKLSVDYERYQRRTLLTRFAIRLDPGGTSDVQLQFGGRFLDGYEITSVQPPPVNGTTAGGRLEYVFAAPREGPLLVSIWARPRHFGRTAIDVHSERENVQLPIIVYP